MSREACQNQLSTEWHPHSAYLVLPSHLATLSQPDEMPQRLTDVLGKLYRPPTDGTRQVFALSRADAEKLPQLPSIAVISITAPERPPADIKGFVHVLRLSFADVDFFNPDLSERARGKLSHAFTPEHSHAIRSFVDALPSEIASVVIHCEGGYSRSCAVAVALHRLYGFHAEHQHLAQANPSIVRVMTEGVRARRDSKRIPR
ncbi:putative protein tyrosine phosphatase [Ralstonia sp. 151470066-2]